MAQELRTVWRRYSPERKKALASRKVRGVAGGFLCQWCNALAIKPNVDVDHIVRVGTRPGSRNAISGETDWNGWIERLTVGASGLQVLCKCCHKYKTKEESK